MGDTELSEEAKEALYETFKACDVNGDGNINANELGECLEALGMGVPEEDLEFLRMSFDRNGDGKLSISELVDQWNVINHHCVHGDDLMQAFGVMDRNNDGYVSYKELTDMLTKHGKQPFSKKEASVLLNGLAKRFDKDDGKFSYGEFCHMYIEGEFPFKKPKLPENKKVSTELD